MCKVTVLYIFFTGWLILTYFIKRRFYYISFAILFFLTLISAWIFKQDALYILASGTIFFLLALVINWARILCGRYEEDIKKTGHEQRQRVSVLKEKNADVENRKELLNAQSVAFSKIYEAIKMMSGALKTEEIVGILAAYLNNNISFFEADLAILSGFQALEITRLYKIRKGEVNFKEANRQELERRKEDLVDVMGTRKKSETSNFTRDDQTILPLVVENKMVGAIFIEDLDRSQLETFLILASQLALELKKVSLYESVEKLSITDGLTEIYLRRYFLDRLNEETERSGRLKLKFSLLMIDMDHFKETNDKYGHMVGDAALREIASILKANVREIDLVARYGGEEFTVLLTETGRKDALYVAERIRKSVQDLTIKAYDESLSMTVSIGVSTYPGDEKNPHELIEKSDNAMYESKRNGRNMVTAWQRKG